MVFEKIISKLFKKIKAIKSKFMQKFDTETEKSFKKISKEFLKNIICIFYFNYFLAFIMNILMIFHEEVLHNIGLIRHINNNDFDKNIHIIIFCIGILIFLIFEIVKRVFKKTIYFLILLGEIYFTIVYANFLIVLSEHLYYEKNSKDFIIFLNVLQKFNVFLFFSTLTMLKGYIEKTLYCIFLFSYFIFNFEISDKLIILWILFTFALFLNYYLEEKKLRFLFTKRIKYEETVNSITEVIGKMLIGICIISNSDNKIKFLNEYFKENFFNCNLEENIKNAKNNVMFKIENINNHELNLEELIVYLKKNQKENAKSEIIRNTAKITNEKNETISIIIEYSSIYWNDTDCDLLIFENIDNKKELIKLKEETQYKDTVLSNVSHEFRTPLNCIIFMLETIKDQIYEIRDDIIEDYIEPALGSARMLLFQVNDLLDHAQILNGKLRVILVENNLVGLGKEIVKMFEFLVNAKNLNIFFEYDLDLPQFLETDAMRFKQIINNLLGNSLKFTKTGSLRLKFEKENKEKIKISVIDTGIGISQENQEKLFNTFSKVSNDESSQMNPHGIGLGLVISNKLVKALNQNEDDKIYVQSNVNEGSTFYFFHQISQYKINEESKQSCETDANEVIYLTKRYDKGFLQFPKLKISKHSNGPKNILLKSNALKYFKSEDEDINKNNEKIIDYNFSFKKKKSNESFENVYEINTIKKIKNNDIISFTPNNFHEIGNKNKNHSGSINLMEGSLIISRSSHLESVDENFKSKILAADDSPMNLLVLKQMCRKLKIHLTTVTDGKECINKLENNPNNFNIIFMDCEMPIMDGFEATRIIKEKMQNNEINSIPIIGFTGYSSENEIQKCISVGMIEVLVKPFDISQFNKIINKYS